MEEKYMCTFVNYKTGKSTFSKVLRIEKPDKDMEFTDSNVRLDVEELVPLGTIRTVKSTFVK